MVMKMISQKLWLIFYIRDISFFSRLLVEAGAVALGLKTITTRNLALAWRSLQLLLTLLPRLNTHFSVLLRPAVVTKNIEQVSKSDIQ